MMSLKEYMLWDNKKNVYDFYVKINSKAEKYEKISRNSMYLNIISFYRNDPEIILRLCTMEEIEILKKLLNERILKRDIGYIDYPQ